MTDSNKPSRSLAGIAGIVAVATLLSKVFGLVREQVIAAVFGVGAAVEAYQYAYVIPGFLVVLLGGINGPFHSAIVSVLAKRRREEVAPLVETITTLVGGMLVGVAIAIMLFADPLISLLAPGLSGTPEGLEVKAIAVQQLQIMAPMAILAGLIGIGFGTLNAADHYWLPSVSPLFSSVTVLVALGILALLLGSAVTQPQYALLGGIVLAWGTLAGAVLRWLVQVPVLWKAGLGKLRLRFQINQPGVREVFQILGPATFSSGMMQINVYTDLFFASFIPQVEAAAASLSFATLLVQTPLGIVSNVILVPMLPIFARLADPNDWPALKSRIRQGLMLTALTMLPLSALFMTLALPMVRVIYERVAFDEQASRLVASVLIAYGLGMFVYLGRDVLVRVFYALGDGETPFRISVANIFLNALLDLMLVRFGAPGLVLATVGVNFSSMIILLVLLDRKLGGLPWLEWSLPIGGLIVSSGIAGVGSWGTRWGLESLLGTEGILIQLLQLCVAGGVGLGIFGLLATWMRIPEVYQLTARLKQRFLRR
ncbi:MAG: murein biosynthesis integral membrane protein MurJ [Cyanothece sp. SIO1E1]|nr:murein biosynthesis integral membrane protein MurJ [Cyanothece sp. SIO1E1]